MPCKRCGCTVHTDEAEQVADSFDYTDDYCFPCAKERFEEHEQDQSMMNPCQDEGD